MRRYGLYDLTRGLTTLLAAGVAGLLLWSATQVGQQTTGRFWAEMGIVAGAGLVMALSQVLGGWTKGLQLRLSPGTFLLGFVPARRPGKLPPETVTARYLLEYGENALEVAADAISHGARVVIHDDVLATGGTVEAIAGLVEQLGGHVVGVNFVIELSFLEGRKRLAGYDLYSLITY